MQAAIFLMLFGLGFASFQGRMLVEGRLVFGDAVSHCNLCVVRLVSLNGRPSDTAYTDSSGNFRFRQVEPGSYVIQAAIEGWEEVNQPFELNSTEWMGSVTVSVTRRARKLAPVGNGSVVNVTEFLDRYPKKAIDAFKKGLDNRKKGKNDQAVARLEEAIHLSPEFYEAHKELGLVYKLAGRPLDAEREFLLASKLNGYSVEPFVYLAALYIDENMPERAIASAEKALKIDSRYAPAFFNLGVALYKTGNLARAETALRKALDFGPSLPAVRLMLTNVYMKLGRRDGALAQLDIYLAENPEDEHRPAAEKMRQSLLDAMHDPR